MIDYLVKIINKSENIVFLVEPVYLPNQEFPILEVLKEYIMKKPVSSIRPK
ncbi:hypothetical protein HNR32_001459 [Pectinatus brassicae]|uniref:Uncharacterized protein n=1 Tax=Pectinatus brassicae TaxID=862415 RepID=A0A840UF08_9FIRM|nr:hypothetical protein [Pectinatus brassicae]MBB5336311.1 hypothetical protein [Pectinatus brassicae]